MVSLRSGSEKGFPPISSNDQVMSSLIYSDETNRMSPVSPLLTQKNNFILTSRSPETERWATGRDTKTMTLTPFYGPPRFPMVSKSPPPPSRGEIPLIAQFHPIFAPTDQQTYGLLLQSKSYDELSGETGRPVKAEVSRSGQNEYNTVNTLVRSNSIRQTCTKSRSNGGYQHPIPQTDSSTVDEYTPMCPTTTTCNVNPESIQLSPSKSDPRSCGGQASFV